MNEIPINKGLLSRPDENKSLRIKKRLSIGYYSVKFKWPVNEEKQAQLVIVDRYWLMS